MRRRQRRRRTGLKHAYLALPVLLGAGLGSLGHAQTPGPLRTPSPPPGSPLPGVMPPQVPNLAPPLPRPSPPGPPSPPSIGPTHAIHSVEVIGVTAFPNAVVAALTAGLTGPAVAESRAEAARSALVDLYRSHGYVYTTVRAVLDQDRLIFRVVEGEIVDVKIQPDDNVGAVGTQVLRFLNHLKGIKPLSTVVLERWLLLAQDIPGLTVTSILNPSITSPGELSLVAQVSRRPVSGVASGDNRAFPETGPEEGLGVLNFDSFSEFGERTQLSLFGAFNETNVFGQVSEELFLGGSGLKLKLYGGIGRASPSGQLKAIGYQGATRAFGGQLSYPLIVARQQRLSLIAALDAVESEITNTTGPSGSIQRVSYDSLRVVRFGADYDRLDQWFGGGLNLASARLSQGMPALGATSNADAPDVARSGEKIGFTKISAEVSRTQTLVEWPDDRSLKLYESLGGQFSGNVLPPAEKYYLGGPHFNRGYYYGQVSGDKAVTLSNELQFNTPLPLPRRMRFDLRSQFYVFYDWGKAWQNDPDAEHDVTLQSAGGGVRLFAGPTAEVDLEGICRMNRYPNGQGAGISALSSTAFYWQVLYRF